VTEQQTRYDRIAEGYAAWWAPVLRESAEALLDLVAETLDGRAGLAVDVGTGTGTLARAAIRRFARANVVAVDASEGMLQVAEREARRELGPIERDRLTFRRAFADGLPLEDGAADAVVSSFVYQLVPSRPRALREARRVLRRGGRLAYVTWLAGSAPWEPDRILDEALDEAGFGPREDEPRPGDVPSAAAAAAQLRRAGFGDVEVVERELTHAFTPETYLGFVEEFDEEDTFASMSRRTRERARRRILDGVRRLTLEARTLRLPIIYVTGRRAR